MPKVPQGQPRQDDQYSDEETLRRLDRAVRRSVTMKPKNQKMRGKDDVPLAPTPEKTLKRK